MKALPRTTLGLALGVLTTLLLGCWWVLRSEDPATGATNGPEGRPPSGSPADPVGLAGSLPGDTAGPSSDPSAVRTEESTTGTDEVGSTVDDPRRWIHARVVYSDRSEPAAGATIEITARTPSGRQLHYSGVAAADGGFRIECRVPAAQARDSGPQLGLTWWLRIWAPGRISNSNRPSVHEVCPEEPSSTYFLSSAAGMVRGRVVDAEGRAVSGADVAIGRIGPEPGSTSWITEGESDERGEFELNYRERGDFILSARHMNHGATQSPILSLDPLRDEQVGELRLGGTGEISGQILTPNGDPLPDHFVGAIRTDRIDLEDWDQQGHPPGDHLHEEQRRQSREGLTWVSRTSGEDGHFRFVGLQPGEYVLYTSSRATPSARAIAHTGSDRVVLEVEHYQLVVRVADAEPGSMPEGIHPELYCQNVRADCHPRSHRYFFVDETGELEDRQHVHVEDRLARLEVSPDQTYEIGVRGPQIEPGVILQSETTQVRVVEGEYRYELELPVLRETATGELKLTAANLLEHDEFRVLVMRADTGSVFTEAEGDSEEALTLSCLPAGRYLLRGTLQSMEMAFSSRWDAGPFQREEERRLEVVRAGAGILPFEQWYSAASMSSGFFLDAEASATVVAGESRSVSLPFARGGRILVRLVADPDQETPRDVTAHWTLRSRVRATDYDRPVPFGRVNQDDPHGSGIVALPDSSDHGWFLSGHTVPAGPAEVDLETPWGSFSFTARVQEGKLTPVTLTLE